MPARNQLEVLITGENLASSVLESFGETLSGWSEGLASFGQNLTALGANVTALGAPFAALAYKGQQAFDAWDDALDQTTAVLKSTAGAAGLTQDQLVGMARGIEENTGLLKQNVLAGEDMLLTFTNIGGKVFPRATQAIVDLSVAMKQDVKSSAIQLGKALNDPITGITALTRVGVTFNEQQKAMIKTMVEAGDVAGAQGIILTELEKEFGGSAEAAADPIDHLNAQINDLSITLGSALQGTLNSVINALMPFLAQLGQWIEQNKEIVGPIIAIGAALAVIGPIIAAIGLGISALAGVIGFVLSPIGLLIAGVVALFLAIQTNFAGIRDFLQPILTWLQQTFGDVWGALQAGVPIGDILRVLLFRIFPPETAAVIIAGISQVASTLSTWFQTAVDFVQNIVLPALGELYNWFVTDALPAVVNFIQTTVMPVVQKFIDLISGIWNAVSPALTNLFNWFVNDALPKIVQTLTDFKNNAVDPVINLLSSIWDKISPVLKQLYDWFITNGLPFITNALNGFVNNILKPAFDFINQVIGAVGQVIGGIANFLQGGINSGTATQGANVAQNFVAAHPFPAGQIGIPYVPREGLYHLHEGESVNTAGDNKGSQPIVINFNGTGGPTNQQEAQDSGFMLVSELRARGVPIP